MGATHRHEADTRSGSMRGRDGGQLVAATSRYKMPDLVVAEVVGNPRTLDPITCMTMLM